MWEKLDVIGVKPETYGAPDRIRTCDLCLRRAALYPAELRVRRAGGDRLASQPHS